MSEALGSTFLTVAAIDILDGLRRDIECGKVSLTAITRSPFNYDIEGLISYRYEFEIISEDGDAESIKVEP